MADLRSLDKHRSAAAAKALRRQIPMEGQPLAAVVGVLEWLLIFIGLLAFCVLQYVEVAGLSDLARSFWLFAAGGYAAVILLHGVATTRDGYTISLTAALRLPRAFTASSARPPAEYWLEGHMKTGARARRRVLGGEGFPGLS